MFLEFVFLFLTVVSLTLPISGVSAGINFWACSWVWWWTFSFPLWFFHMLSQVSYWEMKKEENFVGIEGMIMCDL
jgi:hypothetical protein